jgi:hypothetical protein
MHEALKQLQRKQRQLEDEEANIHRQKVPSILIYLLLFDFYVVVSGDPYLDF